MTKQARLEVGGSRTVSLTRPLRRETLGLYLVVLTVVLDAIAITAGFKIVEIGRSYRWLSPGGVPLPVLAIPAYVYFGIISSAFSFHNLVRISASVSSAWRALLGAIVVVILVAFFAKFGLKISRLAFIYAAFASSALLVVSRILVAGTIRWGLKSGTSDRLLITGQAHPDLPPEMDVLDPVGAGLLPDLSDPVQMSLIAERLMPYDHIFLDRDVEGADHWITVLKASGIRCELVIPSQAIHAAVGIGRLGQNDTLILSRGPLSLGSRVQKRLFDLAIAIPLVILTAPLMALVAVLIRLESPGPALFRQERIGQGNRPFRIYKFRSMRLATLDATGARSTARDDDRLTRVGKFIRRTSIDELPQLFNVLLGSMSLVGPRPHAVGSRAGEQLFWEVSDHYWMRHALKPGITGLAQIHGYRGATHCRADLEARLSYDLEYLQTWSLWNDLAILFATVKVVSHANAY